LPSNFQARQQNIYSVPPSTYSRVALFRLDTTILFEAIIQIYSLFGSFNPDREIASANPDSTEWKIDHFWTFLLDNCAGKHLTGCVMIGFSYFPHLLWSGSCWCCFRLSRPQPTREHRSFGVKFQLIEQNWVVVKNHTHTHTQSIREKPQLFENR
jgi:hypothetical protein